MNCSMTIGGILGYYSDLTLFHEQGHSFIVHCDETSEAQTISKN